MKFINNDTVALLFLGLIGVISVLLKADIAVTTGIIGAIGGYIGSKAIDK